MSVDQQTAAVGGASTQWMWRRLPTFWMILFCIAIAIITFGTAVSHPELVQGWRGISLAVLVLGLLASFQVLSWGRVYGPATLSVSHALLCAIAQFVIFVLLSWQYDPSFAWLSVGLLYLSISGLPRRMWPIPLIGVFLLLVVGTSPLRDTGTLDPGSAISGILLYAGNAGVALFLNMLHEQRDQLRDALDQLRDAHAALATNAAAAQELAVLRERARLARAMHDDIGHALVVMNVKLEAAQLLYARDHARGDAELEATRALIRTTMTSLRHALTNLRTPVASYEDLPAALRTLAHDVGERAAIVVTCDIDPALPPPPAAVRETLWYVAREALANIERHASARNVTMSLDVENDGWRLLVGDDGAGITPAELNEPGHYGVVGMRERLEMLGGTLLVNNGATGGSIVEAYVPQAIQAQASAT